MIASSAIICWTYYPQKEIEVGRIPSRGVDQFMVRFPNGMRDRIREVADKNGRSMNAEIIARLEASFPDMSSTGVVHQAAFGGLGAKTDPPRGALQSILDLSPDELSKIVAGAVEDKMREYGFGSDIDPAEALDQHKNFVPPTDEEMKPVLDHINEMETDEKKKKPRGGGSGGPSSQLGAPARMRKETFHRKG